MSKTKVLLAEDDYTMVSLLTTLLNMEGYEVQALHADEDVVEAVRKEQPDIVLMDVHLTNQSGLDILHEIRSSKEFGDIRVVMSSGSNVKEECLERGANGFLMKPYMPDDLFKILRQVTSA